MAKVNTKTRGADYRKDKTARLAGGQGTAAAVQDAEALLRRAVMANLLWENVAYMDGKEVAKTIAELIPQVRPAIVAAIAIEARYEQKLRHVPLFIVREMVRHPGHRKWVGTLLPQIIHRADEIAEFMAIYWKDGKTPIAKQVKIGLASAFQKFDEYALAKYNRDSKVKLRDVMFMVHPRPALSNNMNLRGVDGINRNEYRRGAVYRESQLYARLANNTLETPDTWEVASSAAKTDTERAVQWERLMQEGKLGALAFLRNLRNMKELGVNENVIANYFGRVKPTWLLPVNYWAAAEYAPQWMGEIETLMLKGFEQTPKLPGKTIFIVDVSGSMQSSLSSKTKWTRLDVGKMQAVMAREMCERVRIYATSGSDGLRRHETKMLKPLRGFALASAIDDAAINLGRGGIFTRQAIEYVRKEERDADRIIVFSDSQDCDRVNQRIPAPFGTHNYIVDVSAETRGINYKGVWTAEISGWSDHFLRFIMALEGQKVVVGDESLDIESTIQ